MMTYFVRRLLLLIPTLIGVTLLVFTVTRFVPGGPVDQVIARMQGGGDGESRSFSRSNASSSGQALSDEQLADLKKHYGLDLPVHKAYFRWLKQILKLDFGESTRYQEDVWQLIKSRIPVSLAYGGITLVIEFLVCIPLGVLKAIRHKTFFDTSTSIAVFLGHAIPGYVVGVMLILLFAAHWEVFPMSGFVSDNFADLSKWEKLKDFCWHAVLPCTTYLAGSFAVLSTMMKNSLLENLSADYVRTAIAKGLPFQKAVFRHALRNSLIPVATFLGGSILALIGGSFLVELIFNIDGLGLFGYEALVQKDFPVVMGILVLESLAFLVGNILSDLCVALVDPRVQYE